MVPCEFESRQAIGAFGRSQRCQPGQAGVLFSLMFAIVGVCLIEAKKN